ncbi:MAG TPA: CGNR zinc finger domain-containing protein [Candidatus Limnocylindrales bacterium]|nr:CGNR zinc finger domain-containing protein [Candidatus Limnocylindrales bacterium]
MDTVTWYLGTDAALGLANSLHGPGAHYRRRARNGEPPHDHLDTPERAVEFLTTHAIPDPGTPPPQRQLARLRAIRAAIRSLADDPDLDLARWRDDMDEALAGIDYRLRADGSVRAASEGWDRVADDLLPAALAVAAQRDRMRRCGNPRCRWLFVDRSRQGNRIWCEAAVCGNRMRVGRHRGRPVDAMDGLTA